MNISKDFIFHQEFSVSKSEYKNRELKQVNRLKKFKVATPIAEKKIEQKTNKGNQIGYKLVFFKYNLIVCKKYNEIL